MAGPGKLKLIPQSSDYKARLTKIMEDRLEDKMKKEPFRYFPRRRMPDEDNE